MTSTALVLSAILLTGCSAGVETAADPSPSPAPSTTASAPTTTPSATPTTTTTPSATVRVVEATYAGGQVSVDSSRVDTRLGERVVLRFTSDVAEQVHVHGYDQYVDLAPGATTDVPLTLTLPGSYEVELHTAGRPLYQLRTR